MWRIQNIEQEKSEALSESEREWVRQRVRERERKNEKKLNWKKKLNIKTFQSHWIVVKHHFRIKI